MQHPVKDRVSSAQNRFADCVCLDPCREVAAENIGTLVRQEQGTRGERDQRLKPRRERRQHVIEAQARSDGFRDLVQGTDLLVGPCDVAEHRVHAVRCCVLRRTRLVRRVGVSRQRGQQLDKALHELRIEGASRLVTNDCRGLIQAETLAITPVAGQGVKVVSHRQHTRTLGDLLAGQPVRIPGAVPALMVAEDQRRDRIRKGHGRHDCGAELGVLSHPVHL